MTVFIMWEVDQLEGLLNAALMTDNTPELKRVSQDLSRASGIVRSWAMASGGGPILDLAARGCVEVSADKMTDLPDVRRQFEALTDTTISIGVGMCLSEAVAALRTAKRRGGDQIVLYTPDQDDEAPQSDPLEGMLGKAEGDEESTQGEQGDGMMQSPQDAQGPSASAPAPAAPPPDAGGAAPDMSPPGGSSEGSEGGQEAPPDAKTAVIQALKDIKQNADAIQALKESDPAAFKAVTDVIQAMILMAQGMMGGDEEVEKGELDAEEELDKAKMPMPSKTQKRVHTIWPVGTEKDGKIKVGHVDPNTGESKGEGWNQVTAGKILSNDGHAISSRNKDGK